MFKHVLKRLWGFQARRRRIFLRFGGLLNKCPRGGSPKLADLSFDNTKIRGLKPYVQTKLNRTPGVTFGKSEPVQMRVGAGFSGREQGFLSLKVAIALPKWLQIDQMQL